MKYYYVSYHTIDLYICINLNLKEIFVNSIVDANISFKVYPTQIPEIIIHWNFRTNQGVCVGALTIFPTYKDTTSITTCGNVLLDNTNNVAHVAHPTIGGMHLTQVRR